MLDIISDVAFVCVFLVDLFILILLLKLLSSCFCILISSKTSLLISVHFLIPLPVNPYFKPVPTYPNSSISFNNCSLFGLSTLRFDKLKQSIHNPVLLFFDIFLLHLRHSLFLVLTLSIDK